MQSGHVVDVDTALCLDAAHLDLPLADSLMYSTAMRHEAVLWTQDEDFEGLAGVKYFKKPRRSSDLARGVIPPSTRGTPGRRQSVRTAVGTTGPCPSAVCGRRDVCLVV